MRDAKVEVGDYLQRPDGRWVEVVSVRGAHEVRSSMDIRRKAHERSAIHVDPDLERKQAQQAPGGQKA